MWFKRYQSSQAPSKGHCHYKILNHDQLHPDPWQDATDSFLYFKIVDNYYYQLVKKPSGMGSPVASCITGQPVKEKVKKLKWWDIRRRLSKHRWFKK